MELADIREQLRKLSTYEDALNLFGELGYSFADDAPLYRGNWPQNTRDLPIAELKYLAQHNDNFYVIYCQLADERSLRSVQRPIIEQLAQLHPFFVIVFRNQPERPEDVIWEFVNVRVVRDAGEASAAGRVRRVARRISIGPSERQRNRLYTAARRLALIDISENIDISAIELQSLHDKAFDVEQVTREFYNQYVEVFHELAADIKRNNPTFAADADKQAQLLLDRLMFLYFIQKKGWLNQEFSYLYDRFEPHRDRPDETSYFDRVIKPLFSALATGGYGSEEVGRVPFLNGGLFQFDLHDLVLSLKISNQVFAQAFHNLLESYAFTVEEDMPNDRSVAIDPEMLGKVFENLILTTEQEKDLRKSTGSYYTPRTIVSFMCQQSLREYLVQTWLESFMQQPVDDRLPMKTPGKGGQQEFRDVLLDQQQEEYKNRLVPFIEDDDPSLLEPGDARRIRQWLLDVRVVDPAVGSGAFLVGMLQEIIRLITLLDEHTRQHDPTSRNYAYKLKHDIIGHCLYGVDIQHQAVQICELRLWLSLVVDFEPQTDHRSISEWIRDVAPLPNLSYLVRQGDSLIERVLGETVQLDAHGMYNDARPILEAIQELKTVYFRATDSDNKHRIETEILARQAELTTKLLQAKAEATDIVLRDRFASRFVGMERELSRKEQQEKDNLNAQKNYLETLAQHADDIHHKAEALRTLDEKVLTQLRNQLGTFIWRVDFGEVFAERGGFDIVIGNPPYLRIQKIDAKAVEIFNSTYATSTGKYDLYVIFTELGISLCNARGILVYIMPNKFMKVGYGKGLRQLLTGRKMLRGLIDFDILQVFPSATNYTCILFAGKTPVSEFKYLEASTSDTVEDVLLAWRNAKSRSIEDTGIGSDAWALTSDQDARIMQQMTEGSTTLGEYTKEMRQGLISGGDKTLFLEKIEVGQTHASVRSLTTQKTYQIELGILQPLLKGREIRRYRIRDFQYFALYPYELSNGSTALMSEESIAETYPRAWEYLLEVKEILSSRGSASMSYPAWYAYWNPRTLDTFKKPKLLTQVLAKHSSFAFDKHGRYLYVGGGNAGGYSVVLPGDFASAANYRAVLAILNSTALEFFLRNVSTMFRDGYYSYGQRYIQQLPIPHLTSNAIQQLNALVLEREDSRLKPSEVQHTEEAIDSIVFSLFGLENRSVQYVRGKLRSDVVQEAANFLETLDELEEETDE